MSLIMEVHFDNEFHEQFWSKFREHLNKSNSSLQPLDNLFDAYDQNVGINSYSGFYIGDIRTRSTLWLIGWIWPERSQIAAKLRVHTNMESIFEKLKEDEHFIQEYFGEETVEWNLPPKFSVGMYQENVDFTDPFIYQNLFEWLHINLEKIEKVFNNRLAFYSLESFS